MADPFQPKFADLVRNFTSTQGTGNFALGPAVNGFTSFTAALQTGDVFYYSAIGVDKPTEREVGRGTLLANGQISRSAIGSAATNFSSGTKSIALIAAAEWFTQVQSGAGSGGGSNPVMSTRAALAAAPSSQTAALLSESGREGLFAFNGGNLATRVTADPGQGVYVPPASDTTGALGAWVRNVSVGFYSVKWFGAVGDGVTDDSAAFTRALSFLRDTVQPGYGSDVNAGGNATLYIPVGVYILASTTLDIYGTIRLRGEAVGGAAGGASVLKWTGNVTGIRVQRRDTIGAAGGTTPTAYAGGDGTVIEGLYLQGAFTSTESEAHGVHLRAQAEVRDCNINNFAGDGIFSDITAGGSPQGNANVAHIQRVRVTRCRNGLMVDGADTNIWTVLSCDFSGNRQWGVWDSSFLGNSYFGCHSSSNGIEANFQTGVSSSGNRYRCYPGQEAWCSTHAPSGTSASNQGWKYIGPFGLGVGYLAWVTGTTYRAGGSYYTDNSNARNVFSGCYAESDHNPTIFIAPTLVTGGMGVAETYYGSIYATNQGVTSSGAFAKVNSTGSISVTLGELDETVANSIVAATHTTYSPQSHRLGWGHGVGGIFNPEDLIFTYANGNYDIFRVTGPTTGEQFGTGANQPHVFHAIKFALGPFTTARQLTYAAAAPAADAHARGEFAFNLTPSVASPLLGWSCTTGGTPGTQTPFYCLTAVPAAIATSGSGADLAAASVTYAKIQNVSATDKLLGRSSAGAGVIEEIICTAAGRALIDDADAAAQRTTLGLAPVASSGSAADLSTGTLLAARMPALTGDVTTVAGAVATTIGNGAVSLAKMADMATASLIYRKTAGAGAPEVQTLATLKTDLLLTGTNTGDQTITLTGDVAGSGTGSFATTIAANIVSDAKLRTSAGLSVVGRSTNTTGNVADITAVTDGHVLRLSGTTLGFGTVAAVAMPAFTGDVTTSAGAVATTIAANAVTYAKFQQVAASSLVGNATGSLANAAGITLAGNLGFSGTTLRTQTSTNNVLVGRTTAGAGVTEEITLAGGLAFSGTTLTAAGALTPTSVASTGAVKSSGTGGVGYATGAGGAVTQITNKSTGVTLNKDCGTLTMNNAALASAVLVEFIVTNSEVAATDTINLNLASGATTTNAYRYWISQVSAGSFKVCVENRSAGSLSEALVFNFAVVKAVAA
jgi:hypothetical protein